MKDILLDLVDHTAGLGFIENVKVIGTEAETTFEAMDPDRTVILNAKAHNPIPEFVGEFGMGNLGFLNGIVNLDSYKVDESTINVNNRERNGEQVLESLTFEDQYGNTDQYRFMSKEVVDQQLKTVKFRGVNWNVSFEPTKQSVQELAQIASIYVNIEPTFSVRTENGNVVIGVGTDDGSGHVGKRIFARDVTGELKQHWSWPLHQVLGILKLGMSGACVMNISDQGALQIAIDSGLAMYDYILPAMNK
ncbi:MAG: hypothetical protein CXT73_03835 [Methanobacteriota archaeon]|jgi:hypothetical protein|nr:MAG: hypothetical protein CXT73_03835 [Euryarchaeota archaeon]